MAPNDDLPAALADKLDDSFERLVIAYQDRLYGFALRLSGCPADAEDIAQDAFVRAYRALARFPAERIRTLAVKACSFRSPSTFSGIAIAIASRSRCHCEDPTVRLPLIRPTKVPDP